MRKRILSCVVAGALVLAVPTSGGVAIAEDGSHLDGLRKVRSSLENTYLGNQVDKLIAQIDAGVTAEEQAAIEAQIEALLQQAVDEGLLPESALDQDLGREEGAVGGEGAAGESDQTATTPEAGDPADGVADEGTDPAVPGEDGGQAAEDPSAPSAPDEGEGQEPGDVADEGAEDPAGDAAQEGGQAADPGAQEQQPGAAGGVQEPSAPAPAAPAEPAPAADAAQAATLPLVPQAGGWDSGEVPHYNYAEDLDTEKFVAVIGEQARAIAQEHDLYASVMIAQAILESGSGQSGLSQAPNNNLFGIKGAWTDEDGEAHSVSFLTSEDDGTGALFQTVSAFRAYGTVADSLEDYAELLTGDDMGAFYRGAWKKNAETYADAAQWLEGRYATDTHYAEKLVGLIEAYDLTRFDEALDWTPVDEDVDLTDLLAEATSHLGTPYVWGGASPLTGFDCSGLIQYSYREALDIDVTRTTYTQCLEGEVVPFDDLHPGDLLFFEEGGDVHHVAMYLGDGFYVHAPQTGETVKVTSMEEYEPSFAKRIVPTRPVEEAPVVSKVLAGLKGLLG